MGGVNSAPMILIVDDFDDIREAYSDFFVFRGYRVAGADDGLQAIEQARALLPDLILMDLSLPGIDGWEAVRRLKADARTKDIRIVALTCHALAGVRQSALDAGCDAFVAKPCLPQDLATEVRRILGIAQDPKGVLQAG
jgi:two-component system, cell cycle response regulator DivK